MACFDSLVGQLNDLVDEIGGNSCCQPTCNPCPEPRQPYVTCCMVTPPPCLAPTEPQPVKPLQLPCPRPQADSVQQMSQEEAERLRYANFYNNYNIDWHPDGCDSSSPAFDSRTERCKGTTVDGSNPCCEDYRKNKQTNKIVEDKGCPTGFKPCAMKLTPPQGCHPCGVWSAQIQPCPPKPKKKVSNDTYTGWPCTRPCCKHWQPKEGPCKYDDPCKAHCFNTPLDARPKKQSV